jgi:hypothetical protein
MIIVSTLSGENFNLKRDLNLKRSIHRAVDVAVFAFFVMTSWNKIGYNLAN